MTFLGSYMISKSLSLSNAMRCVVIAAALWSSNAQADTLKVLRVDQMREGPVLSAKVIAELKAGTTVTYIGRRGFWANIEVAGARGWVRISALNIKGDGKGAGLAALASGRGASGNVVNTSGTRGLSAEELSIVEPDLKELEVLKKLGVPPEEAEEFAKAGQLQVRALNYVKQSGSKSDQKGTKL